MTAFPLHLFLPAGLVLAQAGDFTPCTHVLRTFEGEANGDQFGWVSAPVADGDGDGVAELLVGAPFHASAGASAGRIYLFDVKNGALRFRADGGGAGERLGHSVRDAGDIDGDLVPDVIAGGPGSNTVRGVARVFSGADGSPLRVIQLGVAGDSFGFSVSPMGDVDGDGVPDLAVGAPQEDSGGLNAGRVVVVSGADGATVLHSFVGATPGDGFGSAVANLGDVNGDGLQELVVGAPTAGASGTGLAYVFDLAADALLYPALAPDASAGSFGLFFAADVGRVNADPWPDVYVGDFADLNGRGKAYVFDGTSGARLLTLTGRAGEGFGIGRGLGDANGDGRDDLLLGSWTASGGANRAGKLEVYSGATGGLLRRVTSTTAGENLGFDAHGIGDVDGDGVAELVGTAATFSSARGRVYVLAAQPLSGFGVGLAGSGGFQPTIAFGNCPRLGLTVSLNTASVLGGAAGFLVIGTRRIDLPWRAGILYPDLGFVLDAHAASGASGVPGAGSASRSYVIPADPALLGLTFHAQALYHDPGAPRGIAFSRGLNITVY